MAITGEQYLVTPQTSAQISSEATQADPETLARKELESKRARHHLIPSALAVVSYFVLSIAALVLANFTTLVAVISDSPTTSIESFTNIIKAYGDNQIISWITIILFWGTVGLAVYTLFWLGMAFLTAARNELIVETAFSHRGHFWEKVRVPLIKLVLLASLGVVVSLALRFIAPFLSGVFAHGLGHLSTNLGMGIGQLTGAVVGGAVLLYVIYTLLSFFIHADGIF